MEQTLEQRQKEILKKFQKVLDETKLDNILKDDEEIGNHATLFCEHPGVGLHEDEVIAQYTFLPGIPLNVGEKANMDFMIDMTFPADVIVSQVSALKMAALDANFIMPRGSFEVTPDGSRISYRYTLTFWTDDTDEFILDKIRYETARALTMCAIWLDAFMDLAEGRSTYHDMLRFLDERINTGKGLLNR